MEIRLRDRVDRTERKPKHYQLLQYPKEDQTRGPQQPPQPNRLNRDEHEEAESHLLM